MHVQTVSRFEVLEGIENIYSVKSRCKSSGSLEKCDRNITHYLKQYKVWLRLFQYLLHAVEFCSFSCLRYQNGALLRTDCIWTTAHGYMHAAFTCASRQGTKLVHINVVHCMTICVGECSRNSFALDKHLSLWFVLFLLERQIWSVQGRELRCRHKLTVDDRVWSMALNSGGGHLVSGTAGCNGVPPLQLWDVNKFVSFSPRYLMKGSV